MYRIRQFVSIRCLTLPILLTCFVIDAAADPLPGEIRKFSQLPENGVTLPTGTGAVQQYWGHDELSTVYGPITAAGSMPQVYRGHFMADDFADKFSSPVVHIRWWGSYLNNFTQNLPVDKFLISFESDVPDPNPTNPADFSHPGQPLLNQIVRRGPIGTRLGDVYGDADQRRWPTAQRNAVRVQRGAASGQGVFPKARHGVLAQDRGAGRSAAGACDHRSDQAADVRAALGLA